MAESAVRFTDGARYETMMGPWTRSVGEVFLDWLQAPEGLTWVDIGCGSGAFTELVVERAAPASIVGIDPSEAQLAFARSRGLDGKARFELGDAMSIGLPDASVDVAASALVVHFMPDPARGVAEMRRVTRSGGWVASYAWDLSAGGFPYDALHRHMSAAGYPPAQPPSPKAAEAAELDRLWSTAGLERITSRKISVTRQFQDFDSYWQAALSAPRIRMAIDTMPAAMLEGIRMAVLQELSPNATGAITPVARANAIYGRVP